MKIIKYCVLEEVNLGTDEKPEIVRKLRPKSVPWSIDNEEAVKKDAYNGEMTVVTVEDIPMTDEEARAQRDKLLAETDWTQVLDAPIDAATREAYRAYRQALRDIPEQEGFPAAITWPELPKITKADPDPVDTAVDTMLGGETA